MKAGGAFGGWTSLSSSVLCPGPSPDHVKRTHQLDSWQTDRFFPCRLSPTAGGLDFFRMGGFGVVVFFVTSNGSAV